MISRCFQNLSFSHVSIIEHLKQEIDNFVTFKHISRCTDFLTTIPTLGERWHFDTLNTYKKVQILISGCFLNLSFSHGSIVEHFKQEIDNFVMIKDISMNTDLLLTIPTLAERRHFDTQNTHKKSTNSDSDMFSKLEFFPLIHSRRFQSRKRQLRYNQRYLKEY